MTGGCRSTQQRKEKKMPSEEKVQIAEGTILNLDLTRDGKIVFKVRRDKDGPFEIISEEELKGSVLKPGKKIQGDYLYSQVLSVEALKENPIKVYVNTPYGRICILIDEYTGQYLGPC
jgi:hypothetical protein